MLVDDNGIDDGPFRVADFAPNEDGEWWAQTEGRAVCLRITRQKGDEIWSVDGTGKSYHYRMVPVAQEAWRNGVPSATRGA